MLWIFLKFHKALAMYGYWLFVQKKSVKLHEGLLRPVSIK